MRRQEVTKAAFKSPDDVSGSLRPSRKTTRRSQLRYNRFTAHPLSSNCVIAPPEMPSDRPFKQRRTFGKKRRDNGAGRPLASPVSRLVRCAARRVCVFTGCFGARQHRRPEPRPDRPDSWFTAVVGWPRGQAQLGHPVAWAQPSKQAGKHAVYPARLHIIPSHVRGGFGGI